MTHIQSRLDQWPSGFGVKSLGKQGGRQGGWAVKWLAQVTWQAEQVDPTSCN